MTFDSVLVAALGAFLTLSQTYAQFVTRSGQQFKLNKDNFNLGGANNYYISVKSKPLVDDVFEDANKMRIPVIRTWAFNVVGNKDGGSWPPNVQDNVNSNSVYYQYWDTNAKESKVNEGPKGIQKLEYIIKKRGILA